MIERVVQKDSKVIGFSNLAEASKLFLNNPAIYYGGVSPESSENRNVVGVKMFISPATGTEEASLLFLQHFYSSVDELLKAAGVRAVQQINFFRHYVNDPINLGYFMLCDVVGETKHKSTILLTEDEVKILSQLHNTLPENSESSKEIALLTKIVLCPNLAYAKTLFAFFNSSDSQNPNQPLHHQLLKLEDRIDKNAITVARLRRTPDSIILHEMLQGFI